MTMADPDKDDGGFSRFPGIDPYIDWALGAGRSHYFLSGRQQKWFPVLLHLKGITVPQFKEGLFFIKDSDERIQWRESIHPSPFFTSSRAGRTEGTYCAAMATSGFLDFLKRDEELRDVVTSVTLGLPLNSESLPKNGTPGRKGRS